MRVIETVAAMATTGFSAMGGQRSALR